eukprot:scaffold7029_cov375-Pinguiococcus_pyrenoidosus.AAC.23
MCFFSRGGGLSNPSESSTDVDVDICPSFLRFFSCLLSALEWPKLTRRRELHLLSCSRVREGDGVRVQQKPVARCPCCPFGVECVAQDRQPDAGHVYSQLMRPSRLGRQPEVALHAFL